MATRQEYPDDVFADSRMSFGEHLEELRLHLWKAILGFLACLFISFFFGQWVLRFIASPVEEQLGAFYDRRVVEVAKNLQGGDAALVKMNEPQEFPLEVKLSKVASALTKYTGQKVDIAAEDDEWVELPARLSPLSLAILLQKPSQIVGHRPGLSTLSVQEAFMAYFMVCVMSGFVLGCPWIFYQLWLFVAAGLYPHEKRYIHIYLPLSVALFLGGCALCQFAVIPKAIEALLWFNEWTGLDPDIRFNEWLGFAIMMPLVFGISFQLPLVMQFLERIGVMTVEGYLRMWKIAVFGIHVFAAVITPSIDIISMEFLAIPMVGLYVLGIFLCKLRPHDPSADLDLAESEEQIGV